MTISDIRAILFTTRLSHYLNEQELDILLKYCDVIHFENGDVILKQGREIKGLYIILQGTAFITAKILGEGITKLASLGHGNFMGELSIFDKKPSSTSIIAASEVTCLFINYDYLTTLELLHPKTFYQINHAIANEIIGYFKNTYEKITKILQRTEMSTRSFFSEAIKSLNIFTLLKKEEAKEYRTQLLRMDFFTYSSTETKELLNYCEFIETPTECTLIQEDVLDFSVYIILFGAVETRIIYDNKVVKLAVLGPLEIFSSVSILNPTIPSIMNYMTCERAVLLKISGERLKALQKADKAIWYKLFNLIFQSFVNLERAAEKLDIRLNSELYNR